MANQPFEPKGLRFFNKATGQEMLLVAPGEPYAGWLCYRHPDGQWVTIREATAEDHKAIDESLYRDLCKAVGWNPEAPEEPDHAT